MARLSMGLMLLAVAASGDVAAQSGAQQTPCLARPTRACVSAMAVVAPTDMAGVETLFHVAEAQLAAADLKATTRTLGQARAAASALADGGQRRDALAALAISGTVIKAAEQATAGHVTDALGTLATIAEQARESGYISLLFANLAEGHARAGRTTSAADVMAVAITLAGGVEDESMRRLTEIEVAVRQAAVQAHAGKLAEARATAAGLRGNMRGDALQRIAEATAAAEARTGRTARALATAAAIDGPAEKIQALCALADIHSEARRPAEAAEAMRRAAAEALALPTVSDAYAEAIARIVRSEAKAAHLTVAMTLATGLTADVWRVVALESIAAAAPD